MNTSFWSQCQGLVGRLQQSSNAPRAHSRRRALRMPEPLETRTLLSITPAMVADISPGAAAAIASNFAAIGATTYFTADDGVHGQELWKSDGTAAGTRMVKDINSGGGSSNPGNLINVNGTLFFNAYDDLHGNELWKSDGTVSGTTLVQDINATPIFFTNGTYGSWIGEPTNVNGTLFFFAYDDHNGAGLWKSDGTAAGTVRVVRTLGGELTNVNGTLFFTHDDGIHGAELWKSDGTEAGTTLVKDISPGNTYYYYGYFPSSSTPANLTNVNGTLFFTAYNSSAGRELWTSDGTEAGTILVQDIFPGRTVSYDGNTLYPYSSNPSHLTNVNGTLFFSADDGIHGNELWKFDSTAGTMMVKDLNHGSAPSNIANLTNVNGTLFLSAFTPTTGQELWKSDGTALGTVMVNEISPGVGNANPTFLTNVNGTVYFSASTPTTGQELWKSDGTASGTAMVADIQPGGAPSSPANLTNANGTLFFTADDGIHGAELWTFPGGSGAAAPSLVVNGFPTTTTAGAAGNFAVTARNTTGTTNAGYTGTVRFTTTDQQATIIDPATGHVVALQGFIYTFTAADHGSRTFSATLKTAGTQSITAADTQTSTTAGTEGNILVKPASASTMALTGFPLTTTAGTAHNVTVTLKDPYGNVASGYTGTLHFTSSDANAKLPANYRFTSADVGSHVFSVTLKTAGTRSLTAADTLNSALKATEAGITVNAAAASKFLITAPSTVNRGTAFSLTLTVVDVYGNVVTGYTGRVHFSSSDQNAVLPANYTFTAGDNGKHTFTGLVLRKRENQKITIGDLQNNWLTATVAVKVH